MRTMMMILKCMRLLRLQCLGTDRQISEDKLKEAEEVRLTMVRLYSTEEETETHRESDTQTEVHLYRDTERADSIIIIMNTV